MKVLHVNSVFPRSSGGKGPKSFGRWGSLKDRRHSSQGSLTTLSVPHHRGNPRHSADSDSGTECVQTFQRAALYILGEKAQMKVMKCVVCLLSKSLLLHDKQRKLFLWKRKYGYHENRNKKMIDLIDKHQADHQTDCRHILKHMTVGETFDLMGLYQKKSLSNMPHRWCCCYCVEYCCIGR